MKVHKHILPAALIASLGVMACTIPTWINSVEADAKVAAPIAASLIDVIDPSLAPAVTLIETGFNALVKTLDDYKAGPTGTNLQAVEAAFNAVSANVAQLETAAQVKDPATRATVTAVVQLLGQNSSAFALPFSTASISGGGSSLPSTITSPALSWGPAGQLWMYLF